MSIVLDKEPIRCAFVVINEAKKNNLNDEMEYSMRLIIPKGSATHNLLDNEIARIVVEKFGNNPPAGLSTTLRDADAEAEAKGQEVDSYMEDCMFMNVRTQKKPGLVGPDGLLMANPEEPRSGDYFYVSLGGFFYPKPNPGVSFGLNNVQFVKKGDTLTGRKRAESEFGAVKDVDLSADSMLE
jgi:hypothetical protein